jgi:hypothetical protein
MLELNLFEPIWKSVTSFITASLSRVFIIYGLGGGGGISHLFPLIIYMTSLWQQQNSHDPPPRIDQKRSWPPPHFI